MGNDRYSLPHNHLDLSSSPASRLVEDRVHRPCQGICSLEVTHDKALDQKADLL